MIERNYKSDFKIIEKNLNGDLTTPFRFHYFTSQPKFYTVEFNGIDYKNCRRLEDGSLLVVFNAHYLQPGHLMVERKYYLTDADYADGICNLVSVEDTGVKLTKGKTDESNATVQVYPNYQKGDKGDALTWENMSNDSKEEMTQLLTDKFANEIFTLSEVKQRVGELEKIDHSKYLTEHQDISHLATKSEVDANLSGKMDVVTLSTVATSGNYNDLTNKPTIPTKVSQLENDKKYLTSYIDTVYDDTALSNRVTALEGIDHSKYALKSEIPSLDGYAQKSEIPSLDGYATHRWVTETINASLSDLPESGISEETDPVFTNWIASNEVAYMSNIPTKVSQLENDKKYLTSYIDTVYDDTALSNRVTALEGIDHSKYAQKSEIPSLDGYATTDWVSAQSYLTEHQDISHLATKSEIPSTEGLATEEYVNTVVGDIASALDILNGEEV